MHGTLIHSSRKRCWSAAVIAMVLLTSGCELAELRHEPLPTIVEPAKVDDGLNVYLDTMNGLASPDPARQADVFYEVEREYTRAPTTTSTLRYAVARVTPGHPASNAQEGKRLLETLLATPERMTQEERVFAQVLLH